MSKHFTEQALDLAKSELQNYKKLTNNSEWKQTWDVLPELDKECLAIVNGEYKLVHMTQEQDNYYDGGAVYDIWVSTDGYGDIIEHHDVYMWKYLEEKPTPIPMPFNIYKLNYGMSIEFKDFIATAKEVPEQELKKEYENYLKGFDDELNR